MPKIDIVNAKNIIESNPEKAFFKLKNTGGPKGDTGAQGPQGPKGDTGPQGAPGASASVTVGSTTTLSPGADATVTNSGDTRNAILNFGIPTGAKGPKGDTGSKGDTGPMGPKGAKGDTGAAATVQVGNTNTGAPGTNAQVTNAGNEHFAVFNFTIPRGDKGETGATGAQGPKGDTGAQGPQGIQGPKGDTGSVKSDVVAELPETGEEDTFYLVNREATEQTATGKTINFTNSDNSGDITDFQLDGETSQQTYTGKNLLEYVSRFIPFSNYGLTTTIDATTGVITINGTFTSTTAKDIPIIDNSISIDINQSESYYIGIKYISGAKTGDSNFTARTVLDGGSYYWNNAVPLVHENRSVSCNITNAVRFDNVRFFVPVGSTFDNYKILPYLNHGATGYEPYVGGIASPNPGYPQTVNTTTGENVVQICGKNLFDLTDFTSSISPLTVSGSADNFTITGYSTVYYKLPQDLITFSGSWETTNLNGQIKIYYTDGTNENLLSSYSGSPASGTIAKTTNSSKTPEKLQITTYATCSLTLKNFQLELGSTATAYEPYQGQSYEVNLGKNLFNKDNSAQILNNTYIHAQGMGASNGFATVYIPCDEGVVYTISKVLTSRFSTGTTTTVPAVGVIVSSIVADNSATKMTYTTGAGSRYLVVQVRSSSDTLTVDEIVATIQIEKGSQATSYAPYFTPIELCKIGDYQDYIWNDNGTWKKHKAINKIVLDGSETWHFLNDGGTFKRYYTDSYSSSVHGLPETTGGLSDHFGYAGVVPGADVVGKIYFNKSSGTNYANGNITVTISGLASTADAIDGWMTSNNTTFYYALDTPTDTEITNAALIAQLDDVASAPLYTGVNNITTITPNEQGTLEIKYVTYDKYNQNKVYIWNDTLQQWQIIVP